MKGKNFLFFFSNIFLIKLIYSQSSQFEYISFGAVTDTSVRIKAKSATVKQLQILLNGSQTLATIYSSDSDGYFDIPLTGLIPNTYYKFDFIVNGSGSGVNKEFYTMPPNGSNLNKTISFIASSYSKIKTEKNSWAKIQTKKPNFFMMLGNMYDDDVKAENWRSYESVFLDGNLIFF